MNRKVKKGNLKQHLDFRFQTSSEKTSPFGNTTARRQLRFVITAESRPFLPSAVSGFPSGYASSDLVLLRCSEDMWPSS